MRKKEVKQLEPKIEAHWQQVTGIKPIPEVSPITFTPRELQSLMVVYASTLLRLPKDDEKSKQVVQGAYDKVFNASREWWDKVELNEKVGGVWNVQLKNKEDQK